MDSHDAVRRFADLRVRIKAPARHFAVVRGFFGSGSTFFDLCIGKLEFKVATISKQMENSDDIDKDKIMEVKEFPGVSTWEPTKVCCCINGTRLTESDTKFIGHWEFNPGFPIFVNIMILLSYSIVTIFIVPQKGVMIYVFFAIFTILCILFAFSYNKVIVDGPGYFPFYWPMQFPNSATESDSAYLLPPCEDFSPSGIASRKEQLIWAKTQAHPNRCIFSSSAKRIVLRPDHFCGWTSSWIGKRNHKFFILFNTWGFFYLLSFMLFDIYAISFEVQKRDPSPMIALYLIFGFFGLAFSFLTGSFMFSHCSSMCYNVTNWEEWNHISQSRFEKEDCLSNVEDVCGPRSKWYLWLLPISPWKGMTNEQLIEGYPPYRDPL